jgi:hypothetical protein
MKARVPLALLFLAVTAAAQLLVPVPELPPGAEAKWRQALAANEADLRAGRWDRAARGAQKLLDEMVARIAHGQGAEPLFRQAALARALARAGLGQDRDAVWDYWAARALDPEVEKADLATYGEAGRRLTEGIAADQKLIEGAVHGCTGSDCGGFVRPKELEAPEPVFPKGSVRRCTPGIFLVGAVVGEDGRLHHPVLPELREPTLAWVTLDTLRAFRYQPATIEGKAVAVRLENEIHFRLPVCDVF